MLPDKIVFPDSTEQTTAGGNGGAVLDIVGGRVKRDSDSQISWEFASSNQITLWNNTSGEWELVQIDTEPTLGTSGFTASRMHDIYFCYSTSTSGTLESLAWSGNTTPPSRSTQDGRTVKGTGSDREKRLVARVYVDGSKNVKDEIQYRYILNVFNRIPKRIGVDCPYTSDTSETPSTSWDEWNNNADFRVYFVSDGTTPTIIECHGGTGPGNAGSHFSSLGIDSLTTPSVEGVYSNGPVIYKDTPSEGYHYAQPLVKSPLSSAVYYYYSDLSGYGQESYVTGTIWC
jgi:hypothetical protein